jgi:prefoldin subunit 1
MEEINQMDADVNMYKGVGKMFLMVPKKTMAQDLKSQEKELSDDITNLNKKSKYLEKQFNDAQNQLRDIFHHGSKQ